MTRFEWIDRELKYDGFALRAHWILAVLVTVLVLILGYIVWNLLSQRNPEGFMKSTAAPETSYFLDPKPHLASASQLASEGKFLEAAHELYQGVVLWLDGLGRARYEEHKTGFEYARELRGSDLHSPYRSLLEAFYPVAFGGRPAHRDAYRRMRSLASEMGVPE